MKANSKVNRFVGVLGASLMAAAMVVTPTFAETTTTTSGTAKTTETDSSSSTGCTRVTTLDSTASTALTSKLSDMNTKFQKRLSTIASNQADVDKKVADFRGNLTKTFETKVTALANKTDLTTVQKAAIETYRTHVEAAEKTREAAVDAARTTYRAALLAVIQTQQATLKTDAAYFQTTVTTAFSTAMKHCGEATGTTDLKTTVKTARDGFKSARSTDKVSSSIKALAATRDAAIKAADTAFAATVAKETATLKAILGRTTTSTTNTTK